MLACIFCCLSFGVDLWVKPNSSLTNEISGKNNFRIRHFSTCDHIVAYSLFSFIYFIATIFYLLFFWFTVHNFLYIDSDACERKQQIRLTIERWVHRKQRWLTRWTSLKIKTIESAIAVKMPYFSIPFG